LAQERFKWRVLVKVVMNAWVPYPWEVLEWLQKKSGLSSGAQLCRVSQLVSTENINKSVPAKGPKLQLYATLKSTERGKGNHNFFKQNQKKTG
jgi:hypothetical protein